MLIISIILHCKVKIFGKIEFSSIFYARYFNHNNFFSFIVDFCGDDTHLKGLSGVISSPNFPKNYEANEYCTWNIAAPPGYRMQFAIRFLGIEDHRYSRPGACGDDSISISESRENKTRDIKTLCGCQPLFSFVTSEETMFVTFRSYKENNRPGFYATYQALCKFISAFFIVINLFYRVLSKILERSPGQIEEYINFPFENNSIASYPRLCSQLTTFRVFQRVFSFLNTLICVLAHFKSSHAG